MSDSNLFGSVTDDTASVPSRLATVNLWKDLLGIKILKENLTQPAEADAEEGAAAPAPVVVAPKGIEAHRLHFEFFCGQGLETPDYWVDCDRELFTKVAEIASRHTPKLTGTPVQYMKMQALTQTGMMYKRILDSSLGSRE